MKIDQFLKFRNDRSPVKIDHFLKKDRSPVKKDYFLKKKSRSFMKIYQFFNLKKDRSLVISQLTKQVKQTNDTEITW